MKENEDYLRSFKRLGLTGQGDWQADEDGAGKEDRSDCNQISGVELELIREELLWDFPGSRQLTHQESLAVPSAGHCLWLTV